MALYLLCSSYSRIQLLLSKREGREGGIDVELMTRVRKGVDASLMSVLSELGVDAPQPCLKSFMFGRRDFTEGQEWGSVGGRDFTEAKNRVQEEAGMELGILWRVKNGVQ